MPLDGADDISAAFHDAAGAQGAATLANRSRCRHRLRGHAQGAGNSVKELRPGNEIRWSAATALTRARSSSGLAAAIAPQDRCVVLRRSSAAPFPMGTAGRGGAALLVFAGAQAGRRKAARSGEELPCSGVKACFETMIAKNIVFMVSKSFCPFCKKAKAALQELGVN